MHERIDTSSHELIAARECIALLRNTLLNERDAARAEGIEMEEALKTVTAERDRLAEALKKAKAVYTPSSGGEYQTGWHDAISWVNQQALQSINEH